MSAPAATPSIGIVAGEVLLTIGVLLALFVVYEAFWTNIASARLQNDATVALEESWDNPSAGGASTDPAPLAVPPLGQAFARLHLPTLGEDTAYTVVEGTRNEDLRTGPGHYVGTQLPGEPGNVALAGHRNGSGAVFQHLDRLNSCDPVVVETQTQWLNYRLVPLEAEPDAGQDPAARREAAARCVCPELVVRFTSGDYAHVLGRQISTPYAVEVIEPLPGVADSGTPQTAGSELERMITLTTCHPEYSNSERLIVHAVLTDTAPKSAGLPDALKE